MSRPSLNQLQAEIDATYNRATSSAEILLENLFVMTSGDELDRNSQDELDSKHYRPRIPRRQHSSALSDNLANYQIDEDEEETDSEALPNSVSENKSRKRKNVTYYSSDGEDDFTVIRHADGTTSMERKRRPVVGAAVSAAEFYDSDDFTKQVENEMKNPIERKRRPASGYQHFLRQVEEETKNPSAPPREMKVPSAPSGRGRGRGRGRGGQGRGRGISPQQTEKLDETVKLLEEKIDPNDRKMLDRYTSGGFLNKKDTTTIKKKINVLLGNNGYTSGNKASFTRSLNTIPIPGSCQ